MNNHWINQHKFHLLACGGIMIIGLGAYAFIPSVRSQGIWSLLFLLCPLMHVFMHGSHRDHQSKSKSHD